MRYLKHIFENLDDLSQWKKGDTVYYIGTDNIFPYGSKLTIKSVEHDIQSTEYEIAGEEYTVTDAVYDEKDDYNAVKVKGKFDMTKRLVLDTPQQWMNAKRFTTDPIVIAEFKRKLTQQRFDL